MALWIKTNAAPQQVAPANGKRFTLAEMQRYVGGYIEALQLTDGTIMWLNEEGKLKGLPYNPVADRIAQMHQAVAFSDQIVGDVLVATRAETGDEEDED